MFKLAVIGNPIEHSKSPQIFHKFAIYNNIPLEYQKILAPVEQFESTVNNFFTFGGYGLNITAPFKRQAANYAYYLYPSLPKLISANLLINKNNSIQAYNTDGLGLIADIKNLNFNVTNKKILLIGSGGVIFSILPAIVASNPQQVAILARDINQFSDLQLIHPQLSLFNANLTYDLIINTTPNILSNNLFKKIKHISTSGLVYDLDYSINQTLFINQMLICCPSIQYANGCGMLIEQARLGFKLLFGVMPIQINYDEICIDTTT